MGRDPFRMYEREYSNDERRRLIDSLDRVVLEEIMDQIGVNGSEELSRSEMIQLLREEHDDLDFDLEPFLRR
jgi:hypothetical protein